MLRVGVLLESLTVPCWAATMLRSIQESNYARIELIIRNGTPSPIPTPVVQKLASQWYKLPQIALRHCLEFGERLLDGDQKLLDPFVPEPLPESFLQIPRIDVLPVRKEFSDYFAPEDIDRIRGYDLDVLVRVGFRILRGDILSTPRFGVWSLHHGDNLVSRGGPAGFWESMEGWPTTGITLQVLTEDLDNGQVLARSNVATNRWSVKENRSNLFWKSTQIIPRKLEALHRQGPEEFRRRTAQRNPHPHSYCRRLYKSPTNWQLLKLLTKKFVAKSANHFLEKSTTSRWVLLFKFGDDLSSSFWRYRRIAPPLGRYWADPHILQRDGGYYIFFEDYCQRKGRGRISVIALDSQGRASKPTKVLDLDQHLSYPFVFEWQNETYMIPETGARRTVELYRCTRFPDQWEHVMNLMENVHLVDATLYFDNQRWWMFAARAERLRGSHSDEAVLYYADDFRTTNWHPHPENPIAEDVCASRPAGALFTWQGRLYRPVQDCSLRYGYGFRLCEVTRLSTDAYQEQIVDSVTPDWNPQVIGTHTFSHAGQLTVIDAHERKWRWSLWP